MRLLIMTQAFPPEVGGIQTYAYEHAIWMNNRCEWLGVICPQWAGAEEVDAHVDFPVYRVNSRKRFRTLPWLWELPKFLWKRDVDVILNTQWQLAFISILARKLKLAGMVVIAAHGTELFVNPFVEKPFLATLYDKWKRWVFRNADHFYPVSDYTAGRLQGLGVEPSRLTVVINGTDPEKFFPVNTTDLKHELGLKGKKVLLSICRLDPVKGLDQVIMVLPEVIKKVPDVHYLIVGSGPDRDRLQELASKIGVDEFITFTGAVRFEELNRHYNVGDLFVMPSRARGDRVEGFGIVFLEANACELPVLGSDLGGIPSAIIHNETGIVVPDGDREALKSEIIRLLLDDDLRVKMGRRGRERVLRDANWSVVSGKLFSDIEQRYQPVR